MPLDYVVEVHGSEQTKTMVNFSVHSSVQMKTLILPASLRKKHTRNICLKRLSSISF